MGATLGYVFNKMKGAQRAWGPRHAPKWAGTPGGARGRGPRTKQVLQTKYEDGAQCQALGDISEFPSFPRDVDSEPRACESVGGSAEVQLRESDGGCASP